MARMSPRKWVLFAGLAAALCMARTASAQATGELTGVTSDPANNAVVGANVRVMNLQTNTEQQTVSNADGIYRFPTLPPGNYKLTAKAPGFAEQTLSPVVVEVSRSTRVNVTLAMGSVSQQVAVSAQAQQALDTDNGYKGQIVTSREVENLPLASRSPLALTALTPGVTAGLGGTTTTRQASDGTSITSAYDINGGVRTAVGGFNEYLVDGISMTNQRDGTVEALPSTGSIQEFQVQSGGLPPAFGYTVGGVINYVTKSGTNKFHGTLFEDYRGTATNAKPELPVGSAKPPNNWNQFGGDFGGPVWIPKLYNGRDKTFFFVDYDGSRWVRHSPSTVTVPTALMHQGIFTEVSTAIYDPSSSTNPASRTAFMDQTIPSTRFNAIGAQIMSLLPLPNLPGTANNFAGNQVTYTPLDIITARIDQTLGARQRLGFKLSRVNSTSIATFPLGPNDYQTQDLIFPTRNYTAFYNFTITPTLVYSATLGYTHFNRYFYDTSQNTIGGAYFGYSVSPPEPSGSLGNVRPEATFDIYRGVGTGAPQDQVSLTDQLNQVLNWSKGKHFVTIGSDLRRYHVSGLVAAGDPNGAFAFNALQTSNGTGTTGNSAASLLLGLPNTEIFQQEPNISLANYNNAFYVNDDYRITPELTLNLGLRYEYVTPLTEASNESGWFDSTGINTVVNLPGVFRYAGRNGNTAQITSGSYNNWSPRIGMAYAPRFWKGKTVFRGAFGGYRAPIVATGWYAAGAGFDSTLNPIKPSSTAAAGVLGTSYTLPAVAGEQGDAAFLGESLTAPLNRTAHPPTIYEWNFGVQQQYPGNFVSEIQYSGNRGERLLATQNIDLPSYSVIQAAIAAEATAGGKAGTAQAYLNATVPNPLAGEVPGTLGAATVTLANASLRFPQYSGATVLLNDRDSDYQSLQATLQKRMTGNLNLLLAYTFSKLMDNALEANFNSGDQPNIGSWQNPYSTRDARGPSSFDHTHMFAGSAVYNLPFGKGHALATHGWPNAVVGGFQLTGILTAQSGVPLGVLQSGANGLGLGAYRPDKIGNPVTTHPRNSNGSVQWINAAAYRVADGHFGSAPIRDGHLRGPNYWDVDFGIHRNFHLYEQLNMEFRAEAFNFLNHPNLALPNQDASSPAFGQINVVYNARAVQFDLELHF